MVSMPDGMDWLMRPVLEGMCRYSDVTDGTLDICDVADMNDASGRQGGECVSRSRGYEEMIAGGN